MRYIVLAQDIKSEFKTKWWESSDPKFHGWNVGKIVTLPKQHTKWKIVRIIKVEE